MNEEITATEETINQKEEPVLVNGSATKDENASKDIVFTGKVVQVTNVSPGATLEQMATLFGFLGTVTDIRLYPLDDTLPVAVKLCYIKYENSEQCGVAQHLTNTVFIDKALIVVPLNQEEIPEEVECQHLLNTTNAYAQMTANGYLSQAFPVEDVPTNIPGLPPPPVITCTTDPMELEEIKRTIFVENIHDSITSEQLMAFFSGVGEVKYMRLCKSEEQKYAFIEFSMVESVPTALQYNGVLFGNRSLKVTHAKSPVVKPESERIATGRSTIRTMRDVVKRPTFDRETRSRSPTRRRSRSRTRRSRSRSRSRRRKSRSRSPKRRRSRTRSPVRRRRSYSRSPRRSSRRSRSPSRSSAALDKTKAGSPRRSSRRSRSRSRSRSPKRRKSRSRSRDRRKRRKSVSKSSSRSPRRRSRKKSKSRSRSPARRKSRKSTSKSPDRSSSKKKKKEKDREKEKKEGKSKKREEGEDKEKNKDKEAEADDQELNSLLTKIYTFEEEKKSEAKKSKDKESSDESSQKLKKKESS